MDIKQYLKRIENGVKRMQPDTMDKLLFICHNTTGGDKYGSTFTIIQRADGSTGVKMHITPRSTTHTIPAAPGGWTVKSGIDKYIAAGWKVEKQS